MSSNTNNTDGASNSSSSNDEGWIIAACVVGVIIFIAVHVLLVVVIIWYRRNQRNNILHASETVKSGNEILVDKNPADVKLVAVLNRDSDRVEIHDRPADNDEKQVDRDKKQTNVKAAMDERKSTIKLDVTSNANGYDYLQQIPYPSTMTRDRPKLTSEDYVVLQEASDYEEALHTYTNIPGIPDYVNVSESEEASNTNIRNSSDDEEIFIDPGHDAVFMCTCFEKKKGCVINKNDISISQKLGSGEFGTVHLGIWSNGSTDPVQVAVKTLNSQCSESDRVKFLREAAIMSQFENSNIVRLFGVVLEEQNVMIVLEYLSQGDLQEYLLNLKNNTSIEDLNKFKHDLLSFSRHISAGLGHLSRKRFVHRDLAARNILLSSDSVCKIADFGMARDVGDDTYYKVTGGKIPVKWTAPEAIFYKKYSIQSDVWSFGCVMYEIWSLGHKPFGNINATVYLQKISAGYRLPPPPGCPRTMYELMIQCWHPVGNQRITPCKIFGTLQKSDRILMPENDEEQSTKLGDSLSAGTKLYLDLQKTYIEAQ